MATVARAFETTHQAEAAISTLLEKGIPKDRIQLVDPHGADYTAADALKAGTQLSAHRDTSAYAQALEKGQPLLIVEPFFGTASRILAVLDDCDAIPVETSGEYDDPTHSATPFSFMFNLPVLIRNNPAPLSRMFGLSTETASKGFLTSSLKSGAARSTFGIPLLTRNSGTTFGRELTTEQLVADRAMGIPLLRKTTAKARLIDNPAPFSRLFGLPLLSRKAGDSSSNTR